MMGAKPITISLTDVTLEGEITLPSHPRGLVLFAHGSGSSRHSPRNQYVAKVLQQADVGTLLFDLLTAREEEAEVYTRHLRFDIALLAKRLLGATKWAMEEGTPTDINIGYFGSS